MIPTEIEQRAAKAFETEALKIACEREGEEVCLQPGLDDMDPELRDAFYRCLRAAIATLSHSSPTKGGEA